MIGHASNDHARPLPGVCSSLLEDWTDRQASEQGKTSLHAAFQGENCGLQLGFEHDLFVGIGFHAIKWIC